MVPKNPLALSVMIMLLLAALLSGCGGDDGGSEPPPTPTDTPFPTNTFTAFEAAPTWTPEPHVTVTPRPTLDYDYSRPTATTFSLPTDAPSSSTSGATAPPAATTAPGAQPTAAPPPTTAPVGDETPLNPTFTIDVGTINARIQDDETNALRQLFTGPPNVSFEDGQIVITGSLRVTVDGVPGAEPVRITATAAPLSGKFALSPGEAVFTNDNTPYEGNVLDVLDPLRALIDAEISMTYADLRPTDSDYFIVRLTVSEGLLTVETRSLP